LATFAHSTIFSLRTNPRRRRFVDSEGTSVFERRFRFRIPRLLSRDASLANNLNHALRGILFRRIRLLLGKGPVTKEIAERQATDGQRSDSQKVTSAGQAHGKLLIRGVD